MYEHKYYFIDTSLHVAKYIYIKYDSCDKDLEIPKFPN